MTKKETSSQKIYQCNIEECEKIFNDQSNYKKHMATHGEKQVR